MPPAAKIVHQTRGRLRLRIAEKRKDLPYFLELYEHLRQTPGVDEVTMNPVTGSVLLRFDAERSGRVIGTLADSPLIALPSQYSATSSKQEQGGGPGRIERFLASEGTSPTDPRTIVFLIMLGVSIRQLLKGQVLGPVLTILLYGADLAAGFKKDTEPANPEQTEAEPTDGPA